MAIKHDDRAELFETLAGLKPGGGESGAEAASFKQGSAAWRHGWERVTTYSESLKRDPR